MKTRVVLLSVCVLAMIGCSRFQSETSRPEPVATPSFGGGNSVGPTGSAPRRVNESIDVISNTRTASVISANRTLDNYVSCLGAGTPSDAAKDKFAENKGFLSIEGSAITVTAAMLKGVTEISAQVCADVIATEASQSSSERRLFPSVNFSADPNTLSDAAVADSVRRISRSCWGRNETPAELAEIQNQVRGAFSPGVNSSGNTMRDKMIFLCASMGGSFLSYEM